MSTTNAATIFNRLNSLNVHDQIETILHWMWLRYHMNADELRELRFTITYYDTVRHDHLVMIAASYNKAA